ncbi:hypothetical protein [Lysobacter terrae]
MRRTRLLRAFLLSTCLLGAGQVWAGPAAQASSDSTGADSATAWVAEYRVHDGQGDRTLVLARSDDRVEYRIAGEPVRVWMRGADGLTHQEVFVAEGQVVSYTPGDLRALGRDPGWVALNHVVDPSVREHLQAQGSTRSRSANGAEVQRYRGQVRGVPVELGWLEQAALPASYRSGQGRAAYTLELRALKTEPVAQAFTRTDGMREIDYADIGDMELDPFARRYIREGAGSAQP